MPKMLRHKETGELFIYTNALAQLDILELVVEDPVAKIIKEIPSVDEDLTVTTVEPRTASSLAAELEVSIPRYKKQKGK